MGLAFIRDKKSYCDATSILPRKDFDREGEKEDGVAVIATEGVSLFEAGLYSTIQGRENFLFKSNLDNLV